MTDGVTLIGSKEFSQAIVKLNKDGKIGLSRLMERAARETAGIAQKNIQGGSRTGRIYKRRSVRHQASAPGEFPKTDTGKLVSNIFHRKEGQTSFVAGSHASAPHGLFLELKSPLKGGRPWLLPSVNEFLRKFEAKAKAAIK